MAAATGRTLAWTGGSALTDETARRQELRAASSGRRLPHAVVAQLSRRSSKAPTIAEHRVYILHAPEAEGHALRLQEGIERTLAQACALEVPGALEEDIERCLERVARAEYVVLLQSRAVLTQPWALLAAYRASLAKVPMVCVLVSRSGYDFGSAQQCLEGLSTHLDAAAITQMRTVLSRWAPPTS